MSLGESIRKARISAGFKTRKELERKHGIDAQAQFRWEKNRGKPGIDVFFKFCQAVDRTMDEIYRGSRHSKRPSS